MRVTTLFTPDRVVGRLISTLNKTGVELTVGLKRVDLIAIVANGTLDAEVLAVIAHRLDFKPILKGKVLAIIKPARIGIVSSIEALYVVFNNFRYIPNCAIVIDQEHRDIKRLIRDFYRALRDRAFRCEVLYHEGRCLITKIQRGYKQTKLALIISGLDIPSRVHSIEDHLVVLICKKHSLDLNSILTRVKSSKEAWNKIRQKLNIDRCDVLQDILHLSAREFKAIFKQYEQLSSRDYWNDNLQTN